MCIAISRPLTSIVKDAHIRYEVRTLTVSERVGNALTQKGEASLCNWLNDSANVISIYNGHRLLLHPSLINIQFIYICVCRIGVGEK